MTDCLILRPSETYWEIYCDREAGDEPCRAGANTARLSSADSGSSLAVRLRDLLAVEAQVETLHFLLLGHA